MKNIKQSNRYRLKNRNDNISRYRKEQKKYIKNNCGNKQSKQHPERVQEKENNQTYDFSNKNWIIMYTAIL